MKIYNMEQIEELQRTNYANRIGKVYGDFVVTNVYYDWDDRKQVWEMKCQTCGFLWETRNTNDVIRGRTKCVCSACVKAKRAERENQREKNVERYKESLPSHPKWIGQVFGGWEVVGYKPDRGWKVRCIHCGEGATRKVSEVKNLTAAPCWFCLDGKRGADRDRIHTIWFSMRSRCNKEYSESYKNYGGRGIKICSEWDEFDVFYDWAISNGYAPGLSIDRIDVNGDYCPENCRWATTKEQANNTRSNRRFEINGEVKTLTEWCDIYGVSYSRTSSRLKKGWTIEDALTLDVGVRVGGSPAKQYEINGESRTMDEWCDIYGITKTAVAYRMKKKGMSLYDALTIPKHSFTLPPQLRDKQNGTNTFSC